MRSLPCLGAALLLAVACVSACSVDQSGLETSLKLSHDAGPASTGGNLGAGTGGSAGAGSGGSGLATGGSSATGTGGGSIGTGGGAGATGGSGGTVVDAGGSPGAGGMPDAGAGGQAAGGLGGSGEAGNGGLAGAGGSGGVQGQAGQSGTAGAGGHGGSGEHCSAMNCTMGCCAGDVCVMPVSGKQCGAHGAACTTCGACQTCSAAGTCDIDPGSQWTIVAAGAQVAMSPSGGGTWDPARGDEGGTAPDLFCEYENPSGDVTPTTAGVTSTIVDVYSASWNQTITPSGVTVSASALTAAKPAWRIWVGDEDCSRAAVCASGQIICSYQQPFTVGQLMSGTATITNLQSCNSLNLTLVCASSP